MAALAAIIGWQSLTVHYQYGGNPTGLFWISPNMPVPAILRGERFYLFKDIMGYDGQTFHLMAHDPWMHRGVYENMGDAGYRYQRIFVPAVAWLLAAGSDQWVHTTYFTLVDAFLSFGVYAAARLAQRAGRSVWWGFLFLVNPASIASMDRMTVDGPFLALAAGVLLLAEETVSWRTAGLLAAATLTREVGALLILACLTQQYFMRRYFGCMWTLAAALPYLAWRWFVVRHTPVEGVRNLLSAIPLYGWAERWLHSESYALPPLENAFAVAGDYAAMTGMTIALGITAAAALRRRWGTRQAAMYAFAALAMFIGTREIWEDAYGFGRAFAPLLFFVALEELPMRPWLGAAPACLVAFRMSMNSVKPLAAITRGILGG